MKLSLAFKAPDVTIKVFMKEAVNLPGNQQLIRISILH